MKTTAVSLEDLKGAFAVPPLARNDDKKLTLNIERNKQIVNHIANGGITRFIYGGNAFLYHISLADYEQMLAWMNRQSDDLWMIPSAGPSFGRAMDQAPLLQQYSFPAVMMLPCNDPMTVKGLEKGLRLFAEVSQKKLILYIKTEASLGSDKGNGLDMLARLIEDGICLAVKYAIPREDPSRDVYLASALDRIDVNHFISGIGERPAIVHFHHWNMSGFTTGSGCIQPHLCNRLFKACTHNKKELAESLREVFMPLEDLRDAWSPAIVLHFAMALAGISNTGPVLPFLSALTIDQQNKIKPVAHNLAEAHRADIEDK